MRTDDRLTIARLAASQAATGGIQLLQGNISVPSPTGGAYCVPVFELVAMLQDLLSITLRSGEDELASQAAGMIVALARPGMVVARA